MMPIKETKQSGRKTGIDVLGEMPWGTHVCLFYQTKKDLIDILVPYLKAGLESNEFCIWVTCEPVGEQEAKQALRKAVPDFDEYLKRGQIEIVPHTEWYFKEGTFDPQRALKAWIDKLNQALTRGYAGIRVTGNMAWLEKKDWRNFIDYEKEVNDTIGRYRMIAICSYCIDKCEISEIMDVACSHQFALVKREGKWELIKNAERKRAEKRFLDYQAQLRSLASELSLAEERERRRIATELHDQISQSLVVSKMKVDRLYESASDEELNKALGEIADALSRTIADTRSLVFEVHSPLLALLGFETAMADWLLEQIQEKHGIASEFEDDGQPKPLDDDLRAVLFRDVRELLHNVVRHAHAHKVKVSTRKVGNQICVSVEDDGIGFDPGKVAAMEGKTGGFGLFSIRERLEEFGGRIEIDSEPSHGARIMIMAPLKQEKTNVGEKV